MKSSIIMTIDVISKNLINLMRQKFPDCNYTIFITLWMDDTFKVECRYGKNNDDNETVTLYSYLFYDGETTFSQEIIPMIQGTS